MSLKKDKEKVLDEVWTLDRVKDFLNVEPAGGINSDFHVLLKAYQSMREENFVQFLDFFAEAGRDINAVSPEGQTALAIISGHRKGEAYKAALIAKGAQ